jgi:hypothetical protein
MGVFWFMRGRHCERSEAIHLYRTQILWEKSRADIEMDCFASLAVTELK